MKKQSLLTTYLLLILTFYSLTATAVDTQNELAKRLFTDAELNGILSNRPFNESQNDKAAKRLSEVWVEVIKQFFSEKVREEHQAKVAGCLAKLNLIQVTTTKAFEQKLARPEQLISDFSIAMSLAICTSEKTLASSGDQKTVSLSVNDLLLDFSSYYGKEVIVKGYIVYNDIGSYMFHSKGNMNAVFINNNRLSRDSKKYLMGCDKGCEVTLKVMPSAEESILMKTAFALSVVK